MFFGVFHRIKPLAIKLIHQFRTEKIHGALARANTGKYMTFHVSHEVFHGYAPLSAEAVMSILSHLRLANFIRRKA